MNIQIYAGKKNFDVQKAERWFKERNIQYQTIDIAKFGIGKREFESVKAAVGLKALIDTQSTNYAESTVRFMTLDNTITDALLLNTKLIKTPIVRNGRLATVGYAPEIWETWE